MESGSVVFEVGRHIKYTAFDGLKCTFPISLGN